LTGAGLAPTGRVVAVCVGRARRVDIGGRSVVTAIGKQAVQAPVAVGRLGLAGDEQADPSVHGGLARAVYAYPAEHQRFWQTVRAQARVALWDEPPTPGLMGENLLIEGVTEDRLWVADRLVLGTPGYAAATAAGEAGDPAEGCVLAVSEPRHPCFKFAAAMGFAAAVKLMWDSGFSGAYLTVLTPGTVRQGDALWLQPGPREVNLRELFRSRAPVRGR
jgi:MOSC domain-containing protein YiiM